MMTSKEVAKCDAVENRRRSPLDHLPPPANSNKPLTPFSIEDILNKPSVKRSYTICGTAHLISSSEKHRPSSIPLSSRALLTQTSPLCALEELASKTFKGLEVSVLQAAEGKSTLLCRSSYVIKVGGILKKQQRLLLWSEKWRKLVDFINMAEVKPGDQLSEAAQSELLDLCEDQFVQLEKLHNEIILCEQDSCDTPPEQSVNRLMATEAELKQWQTVEPKLLAQNPEILFQAGKEEMLKLCSELEMVVSCCEAKRDKLRENKELERKWLEEKKDVLIAASDHVERLQMEKEKLSEHSVLQDTKAKIQKMKVYQERLMESLGNILEKHVPLPQNESSASKKKKNIAHEIHEDLISLNEILEVLMNKVLNTPHDPYVTIDHTFWPPYVEMLLRYGIAVRHQENNFKIRLETFF